MPQKVKLYALSTCGWCKKAKRFLDSHGIEYELDDVDLLTGEEKAAVKEEIARLNPRRSYPTLVVNGTVVVGFDENRFREALGL